MARSDRALPFTDARGPRWRHGSNWSRRAAYPPLGFRAPTVAMTGSFALPEAPELRAVGFRAGEPRSVESIESVERPAARRVRHVVAARRVPHRRLAVLVRRDPVGSDEVVDIVAMEGATVGEFVVSELVAILGKLPPVASDGAPAFPKNDLDEPRPATHRRADRQIHEQVVAVAFPGDSLCVVGWQDRRAESLGALDEVGKVVKDLVCGRFDHRRSACAPSGRDSPSPMAMRFEAARITTRRRRGSRPSRQALKPATGIRIMRGETRRAGSSSRWIRSRTASSLMRRISATSLGV